MKIVKQALVKKFGIAIRLVTFEKTDIKHWAEKEIPEYITKFPYWVEQTPLYTDDTVDTENWCVFGGSVGMDSSDYFTLEQANEFYQDVLTKSHEEMISKYPNLWVE